MEEYEEVGSDELVAYDACDASAATAGGQEHEALSQSLQIVRQLELEAEKESKKQASGRRERSLVKAGILDKREETPPQSQENKNFAITQIMFRKAKLCISSSFKASKISQAALDLDEIQKL